MRPSLLVRGQEAAGLVSPDLICKVLSPHPEGLLLAGHVPTCSVATADPRHPQRGPSPGKPRACQEAVWALQEAGTGRPQGLLYLHRNAPSPHPLPTQGEECG